MTYEYTGYLKTILEPPGADERDALPRIEFTADDLAHWNLRDDPADPEWQHVPVTRRRGQGVRLEGRFNDLRRIDNLASDDPSFWIALSTLGWQDERFPVDTAQYPILEVTYRCTSANSHPAWQWSYVEGVYFEFLPRHKEWCTVARCVRHFDFPPRITALTFRVYSSARDTESVEVESIRFRAMTPREAETYRSHFVEIEQANPVKRYAILDEFMPFGCHMDAGSAKRLAAMLGISLEEYWSLALEDIARHHHNAVALEEVDRLTPDEWRDLLVQAEHFGVKFFAIRAMPPGSTEEEFREIVDGYVRPNAQSPSVLAWALHDEPAEHALPDVLRVKAMLDQADPNHPMAILMREPNAFPLFAPFLPALGFSHYASHVPWRISDIIRTHLPLSRGQQLWVSAPGFVYATDTPEWHTCPEIRLMLNRAIASGARGWFTFAYHNDPIWIRGSCERSLTGPFLTYSDLWAELGERMSHHAILAPLCLNASPSEEIDPWFVTRSEAHAYSQLPPDIPPSSLFHLHGNDYELYCIISNDIRDMTSVYIEIDAGAIHGLEVYDLSEYFRARVWAPMPLSRHLEMFPGQLHTLLVAKPEVCTRWRDAIAERQIENDRRQISFPLALSRAYGLAVGEIERAVENAGGGRALDHLESMRLAREDLLDMMYDSPALCEARSALIEGGAALCACDTTLCDMQGHGKIDQARQLGFKVVPFARELTNLRLQVRRGQGAAVSEQCKGLARRIESLLAEIRSVP